MQRILAPWCFRAASLESLPRLCILQANAGKAYISLKLMKRDMETNGKDGGAMDPIEGAGVLRTRQ